MASTTKQRTLRIEYVPLDDIKRAARNPKDHDKATIRASILRHGLGDVAGIIDERTGRLVTIDADGMAHATDTAQQVAS